MLEKIHAAGYVYNDLKLDNLLLDFKTNVKSMQKSSKNIFETHSVNIIDFGFATPYLDLDHESRQHLSKYEVDMFRGNLVFASPNQLKFHSTSRRDDLISLFYLIVFMFKRGQMPGFDIHDDEDKNKQFKTIRDVKFKYRASDLCCDNTKELIRFMREVFSYRFKDTPRYDYLRGLLRELLEKDNSEESGSSKQDNSRSSVDIKAS